MVTFYLPIINSAVGTVFNYYTWSLPHSVLASFHPIYIEMIFRTLPFRLVLRIHISLTIVIGLSFDINYRYNN